MKCPRCGQETVNISNRHICTACGIVISESLPRDQVLGQIRSRVANQNARNLAMHSAPTVANIGQNDTVNTGTATLERTPLLNEQAAGKTLDQISREMLLQNNLPQERAETPQVNDTPVEASPEITPDIGGERVIPRLEKVDAVPQPPQQVEQIVQAQPSQAAEAKKDIGVTNDVALENNTAIAYANSSTTSDQAIYPSRQVNPILVKMLITVVMVLILSIFGYIAYSNFGRTGGVTDNMIKYLGEKVFK